MEAHGSINYKRIAEAIEFIQANFKRQPSLGEIAKHIHLSPYYFHRLFTEWAGTTPKKFLQYISVEYAKGMLTDTGTTVFDAAYETGLSGTGRLHDLFVSIEGMTPGEFKNGGESLAIAYSVAESPFGSVIVASTPKGICHLAFFSDEKSAVDELQRLFPNAQLFREFNSFQHHALQVFSHDWEEIDQIKLHLRATDFQLKTWQALLRIPVGGLSTYGEVAAGIGSVQAARAVGSAIANNPVAMVIPCHRVIQSTGLLGEYRWGSTRKTAMIGREIAVIHSK